MEITKPLFENSSARCVVRSEFDSEAFGFPFHRVTRVEPEELRRELHSLSPLSRVVIDAKLPAEDIASRRVLLDNGFRFVCMQVTLVKSDLAREVTALDVSVSDSLSVADAMLWRHSRNFKTDRFSLDPLIPVEGRDRLYYAWMRNSLTGNKRVASIGDSVCTFGRTKDSMVIDLLSVLNPGEGIGTKLVRAVCQQACSEGCKSVLVTTECENAAAWKLYMKCGFLPFQYLAAYHFVRL